jgi:hypothetical protein
VARRHRWLVECSEISSTQQKFQDFSFVILALFLNYRMNNGYKYLSELGIFDDGWRSRCCLAAALEQFLSYRGRNELRVYWTRIVEAKNEAGADEGDDYREDGSDQRVPVGVKWTSAAAVAAAFVTLDSPHVGDFVEREDVLVGHCLDGGVWNEGVWTLVGCQLFGWEVHLTNGNRVLRLENEPRHENHSGNPTSQHALRELSKKKVIKLPSANYWQCQTHSCINPRQENPDGEHLQLVKPIQVTQQLEFPISQLLTPNNGPLVIASKLIVNCKTVPAFSTM